MLLRRAFLQQSALATATLMVPRFLKAIEAPALVPKGNKVAVIIQLSGGNDGLNTIIPYRNDLYYHHRPQLGIVRESALALDSETGIHPALTAFKSAYDGGELAILNNVGYPNPDRSHFRSMDIWHTAAHSNQYLHTGWLGRYLDAQCQACPHPTQALEIDDVLSLALKGKERNGLALKDPRKLFGTANESFFKQLAQSHAEHHEAPADYLYKTLAETVSSAEYIFNHSKQHRSMSGYPATEIGKSLSTIASMILSDINTRVYYLSLGSFDTHINQVQTQQRLFTQLNDAVQPFVAELKANGRFEDVLLFTFSEFGRRVAQNASKGTDHGTANNMLFLSGGLKEKGLLNALPDLANLDDGDLRYSVDFKQVYATVLRNWLGADDSSILGAKYQPMGFV